MKKIIVMALTLLTGSGLFSQNITKFEYFFDTDPGYGLGTAIPIGNPQANISNFTYSIPVTGLTNGFHYFYIRGKDATDKWSVTQSLIFFKQDIPQTTNPYVINKLEYFVDDDPGYGLGTAVSLTPAANITNYAVVAPLESYSDGIHTFSVRASDNKNSWSEVIRVPFFKYTYTAPVSLTVNKIEYFIDNDPGYGNGFNLSFTPGSNIVNLMAEIPVGSLTPGFHKLFIRAKDQTGAWSTAHYCSFFSDILPGTNVPNLTYGEYFLDTDPGFGNGQGINFSPSANLVNKIFTVDLTGISNGYHRLFIRFRDANGKWSTTVKHDFFVLPAPGTASNINYIEYFVDTDPGYGNGTSIAFNPGTDIQNFTFSLPLNSISNGFHTLYLRARDAQKKWSQTTAHRFYKDGLAPYQTAQISEIKYFIGQGNTLNYDSFIQVGDFVPSQHIEDFVFTIPLPTEQFPVGYYKLYALAKDLNGRITTTAVDSFRVCDNVAIAGFTFTVASRTVTFTDASQLAFSYLWNFGDGTTSTEPNPVHTYSLNGSYNVCLTVANDCNSSTYCDSVTVTYNAPPTAQGFNVNIDEDAIYTFSYASFNYHDEENNAMDHIKIIEMNLATGDSILVDGMPVYPNTMVSKNDISKMKYKPAANQSGYRGSISFRVSDGISYNADLLYINFTVNAINDPATFTISNSAIVVVQDIGQVTISNWLQNLDDGDPEEEQTVNASISLIQGSNLFATYPTLTGTNYSDLYFVINNGVTGMGRFKLIVYDYGYNPYSNYQEAEFTIEIKPFAAQLSASVNPACTGQEIIFTSTSPTQGVNFAWDFGQGATPATFIGPVPDPVVYATAGTKTVKLTIVGFGRTDEKTLSLTILNTPTASFLSGGNVFPLYDTVYFYNTSSGGTRYEWDFGDGTPILVRTNTDPVKHKYNNVHDNDTFRVVLTAINGICNGVYRQTIKFIDASAPNITAENFASDYTLSESKTVSVTAQDLFYPLANGKFYFKGISGNQWNVRDVTVNNGVYETTISETMGDQVGIMYFFDVFNNLGLRRRSNTGFAYLKFTSGLQIPNIVNGTTVNDYQIISIPLSLENPAVSAVLDELGGPDNTKWRLFHYTPSKLLEYPADFQNFEKGKGYWLIVRNPVTINTGAGTTSSGNTTTFTIPLRQGWTQIGNPFTFDVNWSDIVEANPDNTGQFGSLRVYNEGSFSNGTILKAFCGGFIFAEISGIQLNIPLKASSGIKSGMIAEKTQNTPDDWTIDMQLSVKTYYNNTIGFGMKPDASASKDKYDCMTTPRFFNYIEANFIHPEYFYPYFSTDIVPTTDNYTWQFTAETNYNNEYATLSWDNTQTWALPGGLKMVDLKNYRVIDMKELNKYAFLYNGPQQFRIIYGDRNYIESNLFFDHTFLGDCYPNPFSSKTTIPVYVNQNEKGSANIEICIYSADGRKIMTILKNEIKTGYHEFEWNTGGSLRAGVYFCTLYNYTDGTTQTKRIVITN